MTYLQETHTSLTFKNIKYTLHRLFYKLKYAETIYSSSEPEKRTREIEIIHIAIDEYLKYGGIDELLEDFEIISISIIGLEISYSNLNLGLEELKKFEIEEVGKITKLKEDSYNEDFSDLNPGDLSIQIHEDINNLLVYFKNLFQLERIVESDVDAIDSITYDFEHLSKEMIRLSVLPLPVPAE